MMFKKTVARTIEKHDEESRYECDFCGKDIVPADMDHSEVSLEARLGWISPEHDFRVAEVFDCCRTCWKEKVRPTLEKLSGKRCHEYHVADGRVDTETTPYDPREVKA
jgi:hypothetical protein